MKKIIFYTALILTSIFYSHSGFSYQLSAKNFTYVSPSILEFDIYIKGPVPQEYWMGQYVFNFNPNFSNGGVLRFTIRNSSDMPSTNRPPCGGVFGDQLRAVPNIPNISVDNMFPISSSGSGSKIIRMRLTTTACSFNGSLNLSWNYSNGFYTKVYDGTRTYDPEGEYWSLTGLTNITSSNPADYSIDPIPPAITANVLVNPGCGGFLTLRDAFSAINTNTGGIYTNQNVTVSIVNNTTETSSAILNGNIFTSCIIKPVNNSVSVNAASGVQDLIVFDGADNVTIDGRVGGVGSTQLTVLNSNTGNSNCIKMFNGALNNTLQYLISVNGGISADANNIYIAGTDVSLTPTGNDNNKIESCIIDGGFTGIYVIGHPIRNTGTKVNTGTIVLNNEIKNFKSLGVNISWNTKTNRIEGNKVIFGSAIYNPGEIYLEGIVCSGIGDNYIIRNKVYSTVNPVVHTYYLGMYIVPVPTQLAVNTTTNHIINNFVSIIDDAAAYIYGIYSSVQGNYGEVVQSANVEHNTIYIGKTGTSIGGFSTGIGMFNMGVPGSAYNIYNNLSINERYITSNAPGWAIEIQPNPASTLNADYNCYWSINNFALYSNVNYSGLTAYQTAAFPNEQNSILKNANFTDKFAGDLHLAGASISDFDLIGKSGTGVVTDIDLDTRSPFNPYKGADESTIMGGATTLNLICLLEGFYKSNSNVMTKTIPAEVSLRSSVSPFNLVSGVSTILDVNGNANSLNFSIPYPGNYYIVVKNWNMVTTWTLVPQGFTVGGTTNYDFSSAVSQAFGNNLKQVAAAPVRWGVYEGDVNQDGSVNNTDLTSVHSASTSYSAGNIVTDLNGDEVIDADDLLIVRNNEANAVIVVKP